MRLLYNWNKVFNRVMDIKDEYLKTNKEINYNVPEDTNILSVLVDNIQDETKRTFYANWLNTLKVTQNNTRILLHYDLIASAEEMWRDINSINIEARSIYIDLDSEDIVLCPMPKFFNIDEIPENKFDIIIDKIKNAKEFEITNKLDGSNQNATYFKGEVVLCGSTACNPKNSWRVVEGYKMLEDNPNYIQMLKDNPNITFIFEFIHPDDVHVVSYDESKKGLYLLCFRENLTGKLHSYKEMKEIANKYNVLSTDIEYYTLEELLNIRDKFKANDKEGWVLNIDGYRVKFKTEDYLKMHKCFSNKSITKILIKEIADGTIDDFMAGCIDSIKPIVHEQTLSILDFVKNKENIIYSYFNTYKYISDRKDFANAVKNNVPKDLRKYLFNLYDGKEINVLKLSENKYLNPDDMNLKNVYMNLPKEQEE